MTDKTVGTFTPVNWDDGEHRFAEASDQYFSYLGGKTVKVIDPTSRESQILCKKMAPSSSPSKFVTVLLTILKVVSLLTVIIPLIFAIGKIIGRSGKEFKLTEETRPLIEESRSSHHINRLQNSSGLSQGEVRDRVLEAAGLMGLPDSPSAEVVTIPVAHQKEEDPGGKLADTRAASIAVTIPLISPSAAAFVDEEEMTVKIDDRNDGLSDTDDSLTEPEDEFENRPPLPSSGNADSSFTSASPSIVTEAVGIDRTRVVARPSLVEGENPIMGVLTARYDNYDVKTEERIKTLNCIDRTRKILNEEIGHLRQIQMSVSNMNLSERARLEKRIERCGWMLEACDKYDGFDKPAHVKMDDFKQWLGSWYFRALITDYFVALGKNATPEEFLRAYQEATKEFISAPVNFREQTMTCGDESVSFLRCGALYDPTNPYTNMQELKELERGGPKAIEKKKEEIRRIQKAHSKNPRVMATTTFALMQLDRIQEAIQLREETLKRQALQVVWAQLEIALKKKEQFPEGKLKIAHIGLLNEDNVGMDEKSGWYHHEGHEIQDMNAVYEFLHGKTIVFDGTGPLIAEDGSIHMPYSSQEGPPQVLLEAAFFNISIQGKLKHKGQLQDKINASNAKKIRFRFPKRTSQGENKSKTSVEHATLLHRELEKVGFQTAVSCLSGKDRTGWVAYQIGLNKIASTGRKAPSGLKTAGFRVLKDVLEQNYGKRILKVTKKWLNGVSEFARAKLAAIQMSDLATAPAELIGRFGRKMALSDAEDNMEILKARKHQKGAGGASSSGSGSEALSDDEMEIG